MPRNYPVGPSGAVGSATRATTRALDRRNLPGYGQVAASSGACVVRAVGGSKSSAAGSAAGACSANGVIIAGVPCAFAVASCVVSGATNALYPSAAFASGSGSATGIAVGTIPGQAVAFAKGALVVSGVTAASESAAVSAIATASVSPIGKSIATAAALAQAASTMDGDSGNAAWVQTIFGSGGSPASSAITIAAGSSLLVHVLDYSGSGKTITVLEGATPYTLVNPPGQSSSILALDTVATCYSLSLSAGSHTITVKGSANGETLYYAISEYRAVVSFDTSAGQWQHLPGSGTDAITSGSLSPATGELMVGACWTGAGGSSIPGSSNGTIRASHDFGTVSILIADLITPAGSTAATFTDTNGLLHDYQTTAIALAGN